MMSPQAHNRPCIVMQQENRPYKDLSQISNPLEKKVFNMESDNLNEGIQEHQCSESTTPDQCLRNKVFSTHQKNSKLNITHCNEALCHSKMDKSISLRIFNPEAMLSVIEQDLRKINLALFKDCGKEANSIVIGDDEKQEQPAVVDTIECHQTVQQDQQDQQDQQEQISDQEKQKNDWVYLTLEQQEIIKSVIIKSQALSCFNLYRFFQLIIIGGYLILKFLWLLYVFAVIEQVQNSNSDQHITTLEGSDSTESIIIYITCIILGIQLILTLFSEIAIIFNLKNFKRYKRIHIFGLELCLIGEIVFFGLNQSYQLGIDSTFKIVFIVLMSLSLIVQTYNLQVYMSLLKKLRFCLYSLKIDPLNLQISE